MEQLTFESIVCPDTGNQSAVNLEREAIDELNRVMAAAIVAVFEGAEKNDESSLSA